MYSLSFNAKGVPSFCPMCCSLRLKVFGEVDTGIPTTRVNFHGALSHTLHMLISTWLCLSFRPASQPLKDCNDVWGTPYTTDYM